MSEIRLLKVSDQVAPLFEKYSGQNEAQPAYIELDCEDATLSAGTNSEIGSAVPLKVFHGQVQRFNIAPNLSSEAINSLLEEVKPLAERIIDGYRSHWNGNNEVARFSDDAHAASTELAEACTFASETPSNLVEVISAEDLCYSSSFSDVWPDGKSLEEAAQELSSSMPNVCISGEIEECLLDRAEQQLNENGVESLGDFHRRALVDDGRVEPGDVEDGAPGDAVAETSRKRPRM